MIPTVAQFEVIRRSFASESIDLRCSACGRDDWAVEDILRRPRSRGRRS